MNKRLIKHSDVILDGTEPRYVKEKQAFAKLEQLEDIEEELGIDLITLFKALKNGLYTTFCGEIDFMFSSQLSYEPIAKCIIVHLNHYAITLELADYGKTWALEKNELTKEDNK